jgi:4-oxalocrotonate tautomerase
MKFRMFFREQWKKVESREISRLGCDFKFHPARFRLDNGVLFGLISRKRDCCLEVAELPVVQVSVWAGMTKENKKKLVEGMTKVLEELGIPRDAVTVIIYEAKKTNWATGGQLHSEKYAKT